MIDINALDFNTTFDLKKATVGIIGQGFVGSAIKAYFDKHETRVVAYDKFKPEFGTLDDIIKEAEVVFVCVPTPMRQTGECYTGIVQSVLTDISNKAKEIGRPGNTFVVCIKSTLPPGFTKWAKEVWKDLRIVFSPEFLTEKNAVRDMLQANRVVVGGDNDDIKVVLQFFLAADARRVDEGKCLLVGCDPTVAEMVKLYTNGLLFTKVLFSNEVYKMCEGLGIPYEDVRVVSCIDPRIGPSHTIVPGHDGDLGAGGHCFPKDMTNLKFEAAKLGIPEKMFTAVLTRNEEIRKNKDWLEMADRAVTEK